VPGQCELQAVNTEGEEVNSQDSQMEARPGFSVEFYVVLKITNYSILAIKNSF
jgi:hypothetical protein